MPVIIGGRTVVHCDTLIIPSGEVAEVSFSIGGWNLNFEISFSASSSSASNETTLSVESGDGRSYINFSNWVSSLGTATLEPFKLGETNQGHELSCMVTHWLIGNVNKLDVQFMLGDQ